MKKTIRLIIPLLLIWTTIFSQEKKHISSWHIDPTTAVADTIAMDTTLYNFPFDDLIERHSIASAYNGNYGSPLQSKIYTYRPKISDFLFENSYKPYIQDIGNALFYDTTFPYTNLSYLSGGASGRKEEQVKFTFTAGPSKKINIGLNLDYIYSIGQYKNQAARRFAGNIFGRYDGKHYTAYGWIGINRHTNHENGGLSNLSLLTDKNVEVKHKDMPTFIGAYSDFKKNLLYYHHEYSIGIDREIKVSKDSVRYEYVPVTKFGHTLQIQEMKKRYYEPNLVRGYYQDTFDTLQTVSNDTAALRSISNLFSLNLAEEFNKWMKFGLTGYIENEIQQFIEKPDSQIIRNTKSNTKIGGILSKTQGKNLTYRILGDIYLLGYKLGEFNVKGDAKSHFLVRKEPIVLQANASIHNQVPSYFLQQYVSRHFRWQNDFQKTYHTHIGGSISLPKRRTFAKIDIENITQPIYFASNGYPQQYDGNIQVISLELRQDLHIASLTLENNIIYQLSSKQSILPLPDLALLHNLYYHSRWFKDLYPQIGIRVQYHTNYYAPLYIPATGQFANQDQVKIGNYPLIDVYANFHLKQARFFIKYTNLGSYLVDGYGMLMPNYAINPPMLKLGLSWNFYN